MSAQRYYVVGGEYADTSFTTPAPGSKLETRGPFTEREAKVCWRELTGKTVDNAMVRYFLKSEDELSKKKNYWVVGGEYADFSFTKMATGKELEVFGPFEKWEIAVSFWRGKTAKSVDDALVRYDIRENYHPGDGVPLHRAPTVALPRIETKSVVIATAPDNVFDYLMDGTRWPKWATQHVKGTLSGKDGLWQIETPRGPGTLTLKGDKASGVFDHTFADTSDNAWTVPGRVVGIGAGTVYMAVFTKQVGMSDTQFAQSMDIAEDELTALKNLLEM